MSINVLYGLLSPFYDSLAGSTLKTGKKKSWNPPSPIMPMIFNHFSFSCSIQYLCFLFSTTFHSWRKNGILVYYLCTFTATLCFHFSLYLPDVIYFPPLPSVVHSGCWISLFQFLLSTSCFTLVVTCLSSPNCAYPTISHVWFSSLPLSPVVSTSLCLFSQPALPTCLVSLCYSLYALVPIQIPLLDIFACFL